MGIKNLNRFLSDNCTKKSIRKQHLSSFKNKTIAIDTSIYMYKYQSENALLENMKQLIQTLINYNIKPIFVFDGQAPPEKKDLIRQRAQLKHAAEAQYNELLLNQDPLQPQFDEKLAYLKKQFVRIHDTDIVNVKTLIDEMGVEYLEAEGEADQLCAFLVKSKKAWGCLSDDMDMFVYGCAHVLRNFNLTQHTVIYYDLKMVLIELEMTMKIFKEILVLSGTDYNIHSNTSLDQTIDWLYKYRQYCKNQHNIHKKSFYEWLTINTNYIDNYEQLMHIYRLF
jgi:5'-3' exonuclease